MADKSKNDSLKNKETKEKNAFIKSISNLANATRSTNTVLTGLDSDVTKIVGDRTSEKLTDVSFISEEDKSVVNSHMFKSRLAKSMSDDMISNMKKDSSNIYDYVKSKDVLTTVETLVGTENMKFSQMLKDYEIVKRCIPQIHKVITTIKNNIISPDTMSDSVIGIKIPPTCSPDDRMAIKKVIENHKLDQKLSDYVMDYLIASVRYETVIPYSVIPDLMASISNSKIGVMNESYSENLDECIDEIKSSIKYETLLSRTSSVKNSMSESITFKPMNESASGGYGKDYYDDPTDYEYTGKAQSFTVDSKQLDEGLNECLNGIEFVDGGIEYYKRAFLNEAVVRGDKKINSKSMKNVLNNLKDHSSRVSAKLDDNNKSAESLFTDKTIKDIRKNVDFKGCHIENLPASRVVPFKLRDTLIGYYYVEDAPMAGKRSENNILSTIMDKLNSSVYLRNENENNAAKVQFTVVKKISEKLMEAINAKFINDNYDDMDIIYEFVRANELYKSNKRVVFFHPDDVCEYRRSEGSIMKNCMYLAKLYILTMLSNVLTNVTRGSNRNIYWVKTGLTTDIEGHVNAAIRSIKQGQIRYSDIGTINEVFNVVGSAVDTFIPLSVGGEKPIDVEVQSGQNVDMNNDFLNSLLKSIIQSFGVPSSIIDDFENVDFAKLISQSNIDMARMILDAQKEITEPLTKELRLLITYDLPEFKSVNEVYATLNPPAAIVQQLNNERISAVLSALDALSPIIMAPPDETIQDKRVRLFKYEYLKRTIPTIDWEQIESIQKITKMTSKGEILGEELEFGQSEPEGMEDQGYN